MAELLREQYESTFSQPDVDLNIEAMANFFKLADQVYENDILNEEHDDDREEAEMTEDEDKIHDKDEQNGEESEENNADQENVRKDDGVEEALGEEGKEEREDAEETRGGDNEREEETTQIPPVGQCQPELTDVPCDFMDVAVAIDQLSMCSGPGPDGISAILLKKSKVSISLMLTNIFQHTLETSQIPDILKLGFICPILKPNSSREKAASWCPVSLTSHIMKTMERVVRKRIVDDAKVKKTNYN